MNQGLTPELAEFVQSGVALQVGTRDASLVPEAVRGVGLRVTPDGMRVTVFVPVATGARTIANLTDNGRIAICCSRIADHRTLQLKGRARVRPATEEERATVDHYRAGLAENLAYFGLPRRLGYRIAAWPSHAIEVEVQGVWEQTPGPGAGRALAVEPAPTTPT